MDYMCDESQIIGINRIHPHSPNSVVSMLCIIFWIIIHAMEKSSTFTHDIMVQLWGKQLYTQYCIAPHFRRLFGTFSHCELLNTCYIDMIITLYNFHDAILDHKINENIVPKKFGATW